MIFGKKWKFIYHYVVSRGIVFWDRFISLRLADMKPGVCALCSCMSGLAYDWEIDWRVARVEERRWDTFFIFDFLGYFHFCLLFFGQTDDDLVEIDHEYFSRVVSQLSNSTGFIALGPTLEKITTRYIIYLIWKLLEWSLISRDYITRDLDIHYHLVIHFKEC